MRLRYRSPALCGTLTVGLINGLAGCGGSGGSSATVPGANTNTAAAPSSGSPVYDPQAKTLAVSANMTAAITALSDGGLGSGGGGGSGAGLIGRQAALADFAETRTCSDTTVTTAASMTTPDATISWTAAASTPTVTVTRSFSGTFADLQFNNNADGSPSGATEVWTPGPYFGVKNITPNALTLTSGSAGDVPTSGIPAVEGALSSAPATSSGQLGSVGFRSSDGSWTGAPVWEVGPGYVGYVSSAKIPVAKTEGMTMYYTAQMPTVTASTTAPTVGGTYSPTAMIGALAATVSSYSVLGQFANGALPSFTATGIALSAGMTKAINQAGTITKAGVPARLYNPPATLVCNKGIEQWPLVGWKFSQNVAGITRTNTIKQNLTRTFKEGSATVTQTGVNTESWDDPATSAPVSNTPSLPYFDENAGTITLTHSQTIGSEAAPNTLAVTYTATGGSAGTTITSSTYSSKPLLVTTTRNLNDSWTWVQKTVTSGTVVATSALGSAAATATVTTTFEHVVFQNNSDRTAACTPISGTVTTTIVPIDTTLETTTSTLHFGASITSGVSAPSGVSLTVSCSGGAAGAANCADASEADAPDQKPTGCNF